MNTPDQTKRRSWFHPLSILGAVLKPDRPGDEKVKKNATTLTMSGVLIYAAFEVWSVIKALLLQEIAKNTISLADFSQWTIIGLLAVIAIASVMLVRRSDLRDVWKELEKQQRFVSESIDNLGRRLEELLRELMFNHEVKYHEVGKDNKEDIDAPT